MFKRALAWYSGLLAMARVWLAQPSVRRALRWASRVALLAYGLAVLLILALRYLVLPQVASHQLEIERAATRALGMPVRIERIDAGWKGLNPRLQLGGVRLIDSRGAPALTFERVEGVLSWHSLWRFKPILALLVIDRPVLNVRRDSDGRITVAGINAEGESDPQLARWIFEQRRIRIRNAIVVWEDAKRGAPPLILEDLQFSLDNRGSRHRFGLSAVPPEHLAARIDLRGDVHGDLPEEWEQLSGQVFAELDYADLAGWRAWIDYPLAIDQGRGALRVWARWQEGRGSLTADLALEEVQVRFGRQLPLLDLRSMRGRLQGHYRQDDWRLAGVRFELSTRSGIRLPPSDFNVEWRQGRKGIGGEASFSFVDLETLGRLAEYLPLDARSRELLATHQPRGRLIDLAARWQMDGERMDRYALSGRFESMGLRAAGYFPGGSGLTGAIDADEQGGWIQIDSRTSSLDLPSIFPEPQLNFSELRGKASWKRVGQGLEARLERLVFAGPDAAGSASGNYRNNGDGPGVIDLTARVERAEGKAIWRYMPHAVNQDTRDWLKQGITGGSASDASLVLKGDLRHFPFADKRQGEFRILAKARDVRIDYAPGWPRIEGVEADLEFGVGMRISASRGSILGTTLGPVVAELPDFEAAEEMLLVKGLVEGPTAEFLKFIQRSPVAGKIDHLTDDMRAAGNGRLVMKLDMPLRHVVDTRVRGEYQFIDNQVTAVPGLPAINQVNGRFDFSESGVNAPELTGQLFGVPMRLSVNNEGENVRVSLSGGAQARELRKFFDSPLFDHLTGQTSWKGEVRVRKQNTEFVIESSLQGLASTLPEPFSKSANVAWPLRLEKSALSGDGAGRDQIRLRLRNVGELLLIRRPEGGELQVERGSAAIGDVLPEMPVRGVALAIKMPRVDSDFWWPLLATGDKGQDGGGMATGLSRVSLVTPVLRLAGRDFNAVEAVATARDKGWQVAVNAREAAGQLVWQPAGRGLLKLDLKRLSIPDEAPASGRLAVDSPMLGENLPGLEVQVQDFVIGNKRFGKLEARATAMQNLWRVDSLQLQNPHGVLKGQGEWRWRGEERARLDFELNASDIGKLLERLDYPNAVRNGTARLSGHLAWNGALIRLHYPSLAGEFRLNAEKGQFSKLDPGVGKLLGLLSLQSLPRRLSLDFRDIFSEGLAFDAIHGRFSVRQGILRTSEDLRIDGPAARILMKGEADLKNETQNVEVTVQPEFGAIAAVGAAALINPLVGAAALLVNRVLQNPVGRIFAFQYRVTGPWADPQVEKIGQTLPEPPDFDQPGRQPLDKK